MEALFIFVFFCLILYANPLHIAIIGGGIGGASSAYFLNNHSPLNKSIEIDIFNDGPFGGRIGTISMPFNEKERLFESGGSIIHPSNYFVNFWVNKFGLKKKETPLEKGTMGIWNGNEFVFLKSPWFIVTMYRLIKKYGFDTLRNRFAINNMLSEFSNIYKLLEKRNFFDTADELLMATSKSLASQINISSEEFLFREGYHNSFISEYAAAALNCNYGQSVKELNGFVGSVGLAGAVSGLFSISGSNKLLVEKLLENSKANLISEKVVSISRNGNKKFSILSLNEATNMVTREGYDYVIIAAPFHQKQELRIEGVDVSQQIAPFKRIVATFVQGSLRNSQWRLKDEDNLNFILISNNNLLYNSLGQLTPVDFLSSEGLPLTGSSRIWKIFSKDFLTKENLDGFFEEIREVKNVDWLAYPDYSSPPQSRPRFRLADGICYANAIEWLASAIEMSAIGARNCANMALNDLLVTDQKDGVSRQEL